MFDFCTTCTCNNNELREEDEMDSEEAQKIIEMEHLLYEKREKVQKISYSQDSGTDITYNLFKFNKYDLIDTVDRTQVKASKSILPTSLPQIEEDENEMSEPLITDESLINNIEKSCINFVFYT